jgi:hypothetical protein
MRQPDLNPDQTSVNKIIPKQEHFQIHNSLLKSDLQLSFNLESGGSRSGDGSGGCGHSSGRGLSRPILSVAAPLLLGRHRDVWPDGPERTELKDCCNLTTFNKRSVFLYQEIQLASSVDQTAIPIFDGSSC